MLERHLGGRNKGRKLDLHEAGDNKDKITRVRGLITSKERGGGEGKESDASPVIVSWRGKSPHLVRQRSLEVPPRVPSFHTSLFTANRQRAKYTSEHPPTTTATTLATDGADVFRALITDLTSAVSSETLIYQQARRAGLVLLTGYRLMSSNNAENLI